MKRVFFSLVVMCIMTTMTAQTKYELWSVSSGEVKDNNGEVLKRGVVIPETQELCVPKGTTVTFVNSTTKTVYKFKPDENEKAPVVCKTVKNMINKKSNAFLFQI